ncbi:MAG TPA: EAL domain-containing protein [Candidatus Dormibacteraeota bacterium]
MDDQTISGTKALGGPYPRVIGEVAQPSVFIFADETGQNLHKRFHDNPRLMSAVVRRRGGEAGVGNISRLDFYREMTGRLGFGHALRNQRPIDSLVVWDPLEFDAETPIDRATGLVLQRGDRRYEDVIVTWKDGRVGTVSPQVLFEALAGLYGHEAMHDPLTGLANRTLLIDRLHHALESARRTKARPAVLFLDLDDFKMVNDTLGHDRGDRLLVLIAERLQSVVRPGDTLARMGGDEFAVLLPEEGGDAAATAVAERLLRTIAEGFDLGGTDVSPTASVGVATAEGDASAQTLLRNADLAMYAAKYGGKGRCRVYEPSLHEMAATRRRTEAELREAVAGGQLSLEFQPVVALPDLRWTSVEALVRWNHPERGRLLPESFIRIAEEADLIAEIDTWVLREACRQLAEWQGENRGAGLRVAVNLSASDFESGTLVQTVERALREHDVDPKLLEIEVTETVAVGQGLRVERSLRQLRQLGVRVTMDDFGVGHSSLSRLIRFPLDAVKIDRSFVNALDIGEAERKLVSALIATCHELELEIVAEGVERQSHLDFLVERGCDLAQGNFHGPAVPPVPIAANLAAEPESGLAQQL